MTIWILFLQKDLSSVWIFRLFTCLLMIPLIVSIHLAAGSPLPLSPSNVPRKMVFSKELVLLRICQFGVLGFE